MTREGKRILEPPSSLPRSPLRRRGWPPVSGTVIVVSVLMMVLDPYLLQPVPELGGAIPGFALYGPLVTSGEYWRLVSFAFVHGGPLHLFLNMMAVYTLGFVLERVLGTWRFLVMSLATCIGSGAFVLIFNYGITTVGASGMILGWIGVFLPIATLELRRDLLASLAMVAALSLLPGVSWAGHLGGFLFGLPFGIALRLGRAKGFAAAAPPLVVLSIVLAIVAAHRGA